MYQFQQFVYNAMIDSLDTLLMERMDTLMDSIRFFSMSERGETFVECIDAT
ncbi:hypothetical protein ALPO108162_13480 [Alicyclobacillus pomorum]